MQATIYLRDGSEPVVLNAHTVNEEYRSGANGLTQKLVCRDAAGRLLADFAKENVLAYRGPRRQDRMTRDRGDLRPALEEAGAGCAAE